MPEKTIKIAFRGLMVLNYQTGEDRKKYMEIGFLDARTGPAPGGSHVHTPASSAVHVPRILKMENGLLAELLDLRTRRELGSVRNWELVAPTTAMQTPILDQAILKGNGTVPTRTDPPTPDNREYFGWIIDMEAEGMHGMNLTTQISTARLLMVLKVKIGEFNTRLLSPHLLREEAGVPQPTTFGFAAAVTGLDIKFNVPDDVNEAKVELRAGSTIVRELRTKKGTDVIYEISNAPPDVPSEGPIMGTRGHFHLYYDKLFIQSPPFCQYDFRAIGVAPSPDPALCGVTYMGLREDPL